MSAIEIKDEELEKVMARAMLSYLTPEKREELLLRAVTNFFQTKDQYGREKVSEIDEAFKSALRNTAKDVAMDIIAKDEKLAKRIREECLTGLHKVLDSGRLQDGIATAFARALGFSL